jgi:branched-chain amino acid aminotransferase
MRTPTYAFFEGRIVPIEKANVSIMTHALNYGTGAFAGIRAYWNEDDGELYIFRALDHFKRLLKSASLLYMDVPYTPESLLEHLLDLLRAEGYEEDIYIRPLVYKSEKGIGVRLHDLSSDLAMFALPFGRYLPSEEGISVGMSSWRRVDDNMIPPRGKICGAYVNSALTKTEAHFNGYDDALVLDEAGHVSEASAANFFIIRNGEAVTTPVYGNILEGITRQTVRILLTRELGVNVVERPIDRTEVYLADEIFMCGTGVQIAAITSVDHHLIGGGQMGPIVCQLRTMYFDVVRGNIGRYNHWCTPVYHHDLVPAH